MKRLLMAVAVTAAAVTTPALAADVGVAISIGQPDFYGRLDIGGYPQPQVIYRQPIAVERVPMDRPPVYLRVPSDHAKHWKRYCREYNACGERVYFVKDSWYNHEYVRRYLERNRGHRDNRHDEHRDDHRGGHDDHQGGDHDHGPNR